MPVPAVSEISSAVAVLKKVADYIRKDQAAAYSLPTDVSVTLDSRAVAAFLPADFTQFTTADGSLTVERVPDEDKPNLVRLTAHPFPAESKLWNGPDVIPNKWFRSMLASLFHDLIWVHAGEIAAALGKRELEVLRWGGDALYLIWVYGSEDSFLGQREAWLSFQATQYAAPWYHKIKRLFGALALAVALGAAAVGCSEGCFTPPDGAVVDISGGEVVEAVMQEQGDGLGRAISP